MEKLELCFSDAGQFSIASEWFGADGGSKFFADEVNDEFYTLLFHESNNVDGLEEAIGQELAEIGLSDFGFVLWED